MQPKKCTEQLFDKTFGDLLGQVRPMQRSQSTLQHNEKEILEDLWKLPCSKRKDSRSNRRTYQKGGREMSPSAYNEHTQKMMQGPMRKV